jgi:hypothetical protein
MNDKDENVYDTFFRRGSISTPASKLLVVPDPGALMGWTAGHFRSINNLSTR